MEMGAFLE